MVRKKKIVDIIGILSMAMVMLCSICYLTLNYVITRKFPTEDYSEFLTNYYNHKMIYSSESILSMVNSVFIISAIVCIFIIFYSRIKQKMRNWLILPTVVSIIGSLILIGLLIFNLLIILTTAPSYVAAVEPLKSYILIKFENWIGYLIIVRVIGDLLIYTVGAGVIGILSLKYKITKGTSAWLAIITAVLGLGELGEFIPIGLGNVLLLLRSFAFILYIFWLGSIIMFIRQNMKEYKIKNIELVDQLTE